MHLGANLTEENPHSLVHDHAKSHDVEVRFSTRGDGQPSPRTKKDQRAVTGLPRDSQLRWAAMLYECKTL